MTGGSYERVASHRLTGDDAGEHMAFRGFANDEIISGNPEAGRCCRADLKQPITQRDGLFCFVERSPVACI